MQLLLPGARVFLDVDNLDDIGKLEQYIGQSTVILVFLSAGYFSSANCMREAREAMRLKKPLILVHEADVSHGGADLEELRRTCATRVGVDMCEYIFGPEEMARPIVPWHRVREYQNLVLRLICEQLFAHSRWQRRIRLATVSKSQSVTTPDAAQEDRGENEIFTRDVEMLRSKNGSPMDRHLGDEKCALVFSDERNATKLIFPDNLQLCASPNNPGASLIAEQLNVAWSEAPLSSQKKSLGANPLMRRYASIAKFSWTNQQASDETTPTTEATHALLYLNSTTFTGPSSTALMKELTCCREEGGQIIMVHEQDVALGGCEFSLFFEQAAHSKQLQALIDGGLFHQLALPLFPPGPFRRLSMYHILVKLGGRGAGRSIVKFNSLRNRKGKKHAKTWSVVKKVNNVTLRQEKKHANTSAVVNNAIHKV